MNRPLSLPVGISDFKEIVEGQYCYIDKTLLVRDVVQYGGKVALLPRPRRFGKTLNLSMLRYFFEKTHENTSSLFHGLKVWQDEELRALQGQYPVIFLTFKDTKENNWEDAYANIANVISNEFRRHAQALQPILDAYDQKKFEAISGGTASQTDYKDSLLFLSRLLAEHYQQKVVFLLDEYDTPIHTAYQNSYYQQAVDFLKILFAKVLKDNPFLSRGVITGIARIAKEGIFSDLNNLLVLSVLQSPASDKFGFTEEETTQLVHQYGLSDCMSSIKAWYNGYRIGHTDFIYNPWSVMNCLHFKGELRAYWGKTSSNDTIKQMIRAANPDVKQELMSLLQGETYLRKVDEGLIFPGIEQNSEAVWSLLLYTGYLTYTDWQLIDAYDYCRLKIPNLEMRHVYDRLITDIIEETLNPRDVQAMLTAMRQGDGDLFGRYFQEFVMNSLSHHDVVEPLPENSYHMFALGLLMLLYDDYEVKSNRESGYGRYDIMIIPRVLDKLGIVIEFKKCDSKETLEQAAGRALEQIKAKNYVHELRSRGVKNVIGYGIAFQGKKVLLQQIPL